MLTICLGFLWLHGLVLPIDFADGLQWWCQDSSGRCSQIHQEVKERHSYTLYHEAKVRCVHTYTCLITCWSCTHGLFGHACYSVHLLRVRSSMAFPIVPLSFRFNFHVIRGFDCSGSAPNSGVSVRVRRGSIWLAVLGKQHLKFTTKV